MTTTIQIDEHVKEKLDALKMHYRETYNDLIQRIIDKNPQDHTDSEELHATIEILSDSMLMKRIKDALQRIEAKEYGIPLEKVKQELKLA